MYASSRGLEQVAHGIYVSKEAWVDTMYILHLRCGQAVFSHDTALFFHDLIDREPIQYAVTVKTGYNPSKLKGEGIQVYSINSFFISIIISNLINSTNSLAKLSFKINSELFASISYSYIKGVDGIMYVNIRGLREDKDWTQTKIAEMLNCSQRIYSNYERGDVDIPTSVLIKLADIHDTSTDYLLGRTKNKKPYK